MLKSQGKSHLVPDADGFEEGGQGAVMVVEVGSGGAVRFAGPGR